MCTKEQAKEYIEREAALLAIAGEPPELHYPSWYMGNIMEVPAADVVKVVRCGKCVHFEEHKGAKYGVCLYFSDMCDTLVHVTAEDYCSRGEREVNANEKMDH